jgi:imidazolonepropionase-like amidohydrolase
VDRDARHRGDGSYGPSPRSYRADVDLPKGAQEASGVDEVVRAVREQSARGADWIKVYADYRNGPDGSAHATFTQAELDALVSTAHASGRKVSAHASTDEGMRRAAGWGGQHRAWLRRQRGDVPPDGRTWWRISPR